MKKQPAPPSKSVSDPIIGFKREASALLWLLFLPGVLFFWPNCLDRYLAPRFLFVSIVLLTGLYFVRKAPRLAAPFRFHVFDLLVVGWYFFHLVSIAWTFSASEGLFYAQKVLVFVAVYAYIRYLTALDEAHVKFELSRIVAWLTLIVCAILLVQVGLAVQKQGLDNETLYDYATGVFGNKNLTADVLFMLLIFNILFKNYRSKKILFFLNFSLLAAFVVVLQSRTVYLACALAGLFYLANRYAIDEAFRPVFWRRVAPVLLVVLSAPVFFIIKQGQGHSLAERLNPTTYLESGTANERRFVWYKTDLLNRDHFWFGVGAGSWKIWFPSKNISGAYRLQEQNIVFTRAHNDYLEIRSELGVLGVSWFCALFLFGGIMALRYVYRRDLQQNRRLELLVLLCGLLGYCVIQYLDFPRERIELQCFLALIFAMIVHETREFHQKLPGIRADKIAGPATLALAAGLMLNIVIGVGRVQGEIRYVRGLEAQIKGDFKTMSDELSAAINTFYEYNDVAIPLSWSYGIALYQINRVEEAVRAFEKAYRMNPWSFQVTNNYATALSRIGRYREAIQLFEKSLEINPKYEEGKLNIGYTHMQLGEYQKAGEWFEKVDTIPYSGLPETQMRNKAILERKAAFVKILQEKIEAGTVKN